MVEAPLSEEIDRNLRGTGSRARTVVWDPETEELGRVLASLDVCVDPAEEGEHGLAVVAPYFALRDARSAIESRAPHARLLANNFALQGVKLKSIRSVLDAAASAKRDVHEIRRTGHAVDHPIGFEYGAYLKAIYLRA